MWHGGSRTGELAYVANTFGWEDLQPVLLGYGCSPAREGNELQRQLATTLVVQLIGHIAHHVGIEDPDGVASNVAAVRRARCTCSTAPRPTDSPQADRPTKRRCRRVVASTRRVWCNEVQQVLLVMRKRDWYVSRDHRAWPGCWRSPKTEPDDGRATRPTAGLLAGLTARRPSTDIDWPLPCEQCTVPQRGSA